jgi:hypothetical protein
MFQVDSTTLVVHNLQTAWWTFINSLQAANSKGSKITEEEGAIRKAEEVALLLQIVNRQI